jgi:hypothetical protein
VRPKRILGDSRPASQRRGRSIARPTTGSQTDRPTVILLRSRFIYMRRGGPCFLIALRARCDSWHPSETRKPRTANSNPQLSPCHPRVHACRDSVAPIPRLKQRRKFPPVSQRGSARVSRRRRYPPRPCRPWGSQPRRPMPPVKGCVIPDPFQASLKASC